VRRLFVPGPVDVHPDVLAAQTQAMLPHRSEEFETIFHRAEANARKLFFTKHRVFITASSGTGLQEAAVRNFVAGRMLSCVNGAFSKRWFAVAKSNGKNVDKLETEWNQPITAELVAEAIQGENYDIVTIVHNETSTGLMNPVKEIAAAVRANSPDTLVCVDAVSSLSGAALEMDAWGLDMVLTASQKCLALPPGLGFAAVNERAMTRAAQLPDRGWYFDLVRMEKNRIKDSTPATPAVSLIYALDLQLKRIFEEGLENRFARHSAMAARTQDWATGRGLNLFAPEGYRSQTVTTVEHGGNIDFGSMNAYLIQQGMRIANGYGELKDKTFRIGHMGERTLEDVDELLAEMDLFLN
ncbi:MAG: alanine--glyoxylate aminotransferase family protein, partial [Chloroflexi bacterium]|nr:alanine--glyoxylate aminotransferase family protein [Chloroflexota bacterium]